MRDEKKLRSWRPDSTNRVSGEPGVVHALTMNLGWRKYALSAPKNFYTLKAA